MNVDLFSNVLYVASYQELGLDYHRFVDKFFIIFSILVLALLYGSAGREVKFSIVMLFSAFCFQIYLLLVGFTSCMLLFYCLRSTVNYWLNHCLHKTKEWNFLLVLFVNMHLLSCCFSQFSESSYRDMDVYQELDRNNAWYINIWIKDKKKTFKHLLLSLQCHCSQTFFDL